MKKIIKKFGYSIFLAIFGIANVFAEAEMPPRLDPLKLALGTAGSSAPSPAMTTSMPSAPPPAVTTSMPSAPPPPVTESAPLAPPPEVTSSAPVPVSSPIPPPPGVMSSGPVTSAASVKEYQNWVQKNDSPPFVGQPNEMVGPPAPKKVVRPMKLSSKQRELVIPGNPEDYYNESPVIPSPPLSFEQNRRAMLNTAPRSAPPSPEAKEAFEIMMQQNVPLTPQQVVKLRQLIDSSQRAAAIPANIPPKPVSSTLMVNLAPGATPPAIRLAQGYITSLVFVDSTGSPWPIASYDIGDPKKITPQWDGKSNILLIQALSPYGDSDLIIRLVGLPTPITLQLVAGQRVVDYRTDIHVSGIGPNSKDVPMGTGLPGSANQLLLSVLDGIAPPGSKQLTVLGGDCSAWLLGDKMYLRTRFTVLSPGWIGRMVSPDGMNAYEIQQSSSVLISRYGSPIELKIEGF